MSFNKFNKHLNTLQIGKEALIRKWCKEQNDALPLNDGGKFIVTEDLQVKFIYNKDTDGCVDFQFDIKVCEIPEYIIFENADLDPLMEKTNWIQFYVDY